MYVLYIRKLKCIQISHLRSTQEVTLKFTVCKTIYIFYIGNSIKNTNECFLSIWMGCVYPKPDVDNCKSVLKQSTA